MKPRNILFVISIWFLITISCSRDLDQPPQGLVDESKLENKKGVEELLIGAYSLLDGYSYDEANSTWFAGSGSNWIYGSICGSEAYKGGGQGDQTPVIIPLETFTATASNAGVAEKWKMVYAGVQRANDVLRVLKKVRDISSSDRLRIEAESRFLRGYYHFEAIKIFNKVPYVDETVTYDNGNYHLPNDTLIWGAIENDFQFSMQNLPTTMVAVGRANKYAAQAFLAKAYLFQGRTSTAKLNSARLLLEDLIRNGVTAKGAKYALLKHYHDNFDPATKNSSESVFAIQMSVNDGAGGSNGNMGDVLNFPFNDASYAGVPGGCCGFYSPSQYLVNHFKTDQLSGLPDIDGFNEIPVKNDEGVALNENFIPHDGPLDPRLDWTVGRRGIPYMDWGVHPGSDPSAGWIRTFAEGGPYTPMKNSYSRVQKENFSDAGFWSGGSVATNINLIRFADVLLWAAEAEVETGSLEKAREYVNQVRLRAADTASWVRRTDGNFAANYNIGPYSSDTWSSREFARKAIRHERVLELGMEGHRFFDLVRWGIADQEINVYFSKEKTYRSHLAIAKFLKGVHEYFPIPQRQIDLSAGIDGIPKLKQNPGY